MARLLLDVNLWIALFDDAHIHSAEANALIDRQRIKIASCPLVENGVVRVLNLPAYSKRGALGMERVRTQLRGACAALDHEFWPDDVSLTDDTLFNFDRIHGHNQITDAYLLALAVRHNGTLVTFDRAITIDAVHGAKTQHLTIV
jgi:toxin-antitoxin system PIN domain toxin